MTDTARPDIPFHIWLDLVLQIAKYNKDDLEHIPFWWECYRKNYSASGAHSYNYSGMTINLPSNNPKFKEKPFPADSGPDIMMDLGLV